MPTLEGIDAPGQSHDLTREQRGAGLKIGETGKRKVLRARRDEQQNRSEAAGFAFRFGNAEVGVNQANGDAYVDDITGRDGARAQRRLRGNRGAASPPVLEPPSPFADIAVNDPCLVGTEPCNPSIAYDSPNEGYVFVGSGQQINKSHIYAFAPKLEGPPIVSEQEVSGVSESEATLRAKVNPHGSETTYHFEYVSQAQFDEDEYAQALSTP